jgi:hypothetical protein
MNTSIILAFDADTSIEDQVGEINRARRLGKRVLAILQAPARLTREALARANAMPATTDVHVQAWVRLAPARQAAMELRGALGLPEPTDALLTALTPVVRGPALDAEGRTIGARALDLAWTLNPVVVLPAGVALTEDRRPAILADGSALSTALLFAERLAIPLRLLRPHLETFNDFLSLDYDDALELSPETRRSLLFARQHCVPFVIASSASTDRELDRSPPVSIGRETARVDTRPDATSRVGRLSDRQPHFQLGRAPARASA